MPNSTTLPPVDVFAHASASKLDLLATCPGAAALPWDRSTSGAAERGTGLHRFLEVALLRGRDAALADAVGSTPPAVYDECLSLDLGQLLEQLGLDPDLAAGGLEAADRDAGGALLIESAHAWNLVTRKARHLGDRLGRAYERRSGEVPGTLDLAIVLPAQQRAVVVDYKSGFADLGRPGRLRQLRHAALCVADRFGLASVRVGVMDVSIPARPLFKSDVLDGFDLDAFADELDEVFRRAAQASRAPALKHGEEPEFVAGAHCRWCPAFERCPANVNMAAALAVVDKELAPQRREVLVMRQALELQLTPAQFVEARRRHQAAAAFVDRVGEALDRYAAQGAVEVAPGRWVAEVPTGKRAIDVRAAMAALEGQGLEAAELAAAVPAEPKCSASSLTAAARLIAKRTGETIKAAEAGLWACLGAAGAYGRTATRGVREVDEAELPPGTVKRAAGEGPTPVPPPPPKGTAKERGAAKPAAGSKAFAKAMQAMAAAKDPAAVAAAFPAEADVAPEEWEMLRARAHSRKGELGVAP